MHDLRQQATTAGPTGPKRTKPSYLDVIVEAAGPVLVVLQQPEGVVVAKVLKLYQHMRLPLGQCGHKLLDKAVVLCASGTPLPQPLVAAATEVWKRQIPLSAGPLKQRGNVSEHKAQHVCQELAATPYGVSRPPALQKPQGAIKGQEDAQEQANCTGSKQTAELLVHVLGVCQELLVVGADIDADGEALGGVDASSSCVQLDLAFTDAHAIAAQVAKPQDALPVCHNSHLDVLLLPGLELLEQVAAITQGHIQALQEGTDSMGRDAWAGRLLRDAVSAFFRPAQALQLECAPQTPAIRHIAALTC